MASTDNYSPQPVAFGFVQQAAGASTTVRNCSANRASTGTVLITLSESLPAGTYTANLTQVGTNYTPGVSLGITDTSDTVKTVLQQKTDGSGLVDLPFSFEFNRIPKA